MSLSAKTWSTNKESFFGIVAVVLLAGGTAQNHPPIEPVAKLWLGGDFHAGPARRDVLAPLKPQLAGAAGIVNLEGPIAASEIEAKTNNAEKLSNASGALRHLESAGVVAVAIANNHANDLGDAGRKRTAQAIRALGMHPVGAEAGAAVLTLSGVRVAIAAFDLSAGVPNDLREQLNKVRRDADALVVTFHVLGPPSLLPSRDLQRAVAVALEAGATVIASHGTHALARVERRGRAVIAWGLGNLAFDCACGRGEDGLVLKVELAKDGAVRAAEIVPIDVGLGGAATRPAADVDLAIAQLRALESSPLTRTPRGARY